MPQRIFHAGAMFPFQGRIWFNTSPAPRQVRPDGQRRFYSLRPEPFQELDAWVAGYRKLWDARLDRFGRALEKKKKQKEKQR